MTAAVSRHVERPAAIDAARADPHDDFWCACLLLLLGERACSCGELGTRLHQLGQPDGDPERVSRTLLALELAGLVSVVGADACRGAATYGLTCEGAERVGLAADELRGALVMFGRFLARCGERLELAPARGAPGASDA
jgi:hypothetical protein